MATTLYHASESQDRASILEHGLDLRHGRRKFLPDNVDPAAEERERWDWQQHDFQAHYPPGVYLFDSRAAAEDFGPWHFAEADIWRVDLSNLHLALDRDELGQPSGKNPQGGCAFYSYDPIPAERLELVAPSLRGTYAFLCGLEESPQMTRPQS